jgi:hypothetical protein
MVAVKRILQNGQQVQVAELLFDFGMYDLDDNRGPVLKDRVVRLEQEAGFEGFFFEDAIYLFGRTPDFLPD